MSPSVGGILGPALVPFELLYRLGAAIARARRFRGKRWDGEVPVILVGNLTLGGTGKTPLVEALARRLPALGWRAAIVSRGYRGRRAHDPALVSDGKGQGGVRLKAREAGDEPMMLATSCPRISVVVGRNRLAACDLARRAVGAEALVLDDAFQQRERFPGSLSVVTLNARQPLFGSRLLPAGRLRESPEALAEAHVIVVTHGPDRAFLRSLAMAAPRALVLRADHELRGFVSVGGRLKHGRRALAGKRVLALAAIGYPEGFSAVLKAQAGVREVEAWTMHDHYAWRRRDLERAVSRARESNCAAIVTTQKDAARMPNLPRNGPPFLAARVELSFGADDTRRLEAALRGYLRLFAR